MKKLFIATLIITLILTGCTATPNKTNPNTPSSPSASIAEVDRTEEYVQIIREALIELYDYDIEEPSEEAYVMITYGENLSDEFKAEKKHKFKNDFKRIIMHTPMIPLGVIEFFEFTDEKDFDRCLDWIKARQTDEHLSEAEIFRGEYPYIVLTYGNGDLIQTNILESIFLKLNLL